MTDNYQLAVDEDGGLLDPRDLTSMLESGSIIDLVEELYGMVWWLADELVDETYIFKNHFEHRATWVKRAQEAYKAGLTLSPTERFQPLDYEGMAREAQQNDQYRRGLEDAARVARAQGTDPSKPPCPSQIVAVYLERLAKGETP